MEIKETIPYCLTIDSGIRIADKIKEKGDFSLDFTGISIYGTPFFNGLLHRVSEFDSVDKIKCINLPDHGRNAFINALDNFKLKDSTEDRKEALKRYIQSLKG